MSLVLRKIDDGKIWAKSEEKKDWLKSKELPSESLINFKAKGNCISMYRITKKNDIDDIVLALSYNRYRGKKGSNPRKKIRLEQVEVVLIDESKIKKAGFKISDSRLGNTEFENVNKQHIDIEKLSDTKLVELARLLHNSHSEYKLYSEAKLFDLIGKRLKKGNISNTIKEEFETILDTVSQ